jgi:hypothetical protein
MNDDVSALILDDNIWSLRLMKGMLQECFPDLRIEARDEPDISGGFDIYYIDNLFGDEPMAGRLAARIRAEHPEALVIAFSAALDRVSLKALIAAGCNGVCDKTDHEDLPTTMILTQRYIEELQAKRQRRGKGGFFGALRSIQALLREWNDRLEQEARRTG